MVVALLVLVVVVALLVVLPGIINIEVVITIELLTKMRDTGILAHLIV